MKIVMLEPNLLVMAGMTRLTYMMADCLKMLGHEVTLIGRSLTERRVKVQVMTSFGAQILCVKEGLSRKQYDLEEFADYHPVKYLTFSDIMLESIPVSHPFMYFPQRVRRLLWKADVMMTDAEIYVRLPERVEGLEQKMIQYVHFPLTSVKPVPNRPPKQVWCNSEFTKRHIKDFWGLEATVVNPPIRCDLYKNSNNFDDREFDVVMFSRLDPSKFSVIDFLKDFKVAVIGSDYGFEPPRWVTVFKNAKAKEVADVLSRSKVLVHAKGFGEYEGGKKSEPEHWGITITEAMSAGCVPIVPRAGGPPEIVGLGEEWGFIYSSIGELRVKIKTLLEDKLLWTEKSAEASRRAEQFDVKVIASQVEKLLEKIKGEKARYIA